MNSTTVATDSPSPSTLSADDALHLAWRIWFAFLIVPMIAFFVAIMRLATSDVHAGNTRLAEGWFVGVMIYMALAVPGAFFWRSKLFSGYWRGEAVHPREYLSGMTSIWIAIELGGLLALVGCWMSDTLLPNILPAMLAFMLFTPLWPNGHAMSKPLHNERDPGHYEDPR